MDIVQFRTHMDEQGYALFPCVVAAPLIERLREDLPQQAARCREIQQRNMPGEGMEGVAHHALGMGDSFDEFLFGFPLDDFIRDYFGGNYILNSFGALNNLPLSAETYRHGQRFHRDLRTYSGDFRLMLNMLVMLHDFTVENGATRLVPGSHKVEARPEDAWMEAHCVRALGHAGSILLFDSNLWHAAAPNRTTGPRMALTLTFTRPFFKQQMDYPRLLGEDFTQDERVRQLLGYNSRVPATHDEWYQPPERRKYKADQG